MAEENNESTEVKDEGGGKKKFSPLMIMVGGQTLLTLAFGGAVIFGLQSLQKPKTTDVELQDRAIASVRDEVDKIQWISLDPFVTNTHNKATIKATLNIEISDAATAQVLKTRMPAVRSRVLNLLSQQDSSVLTRMQDKLLLKDALREVINQELQNAGVRDGVVRDVYLQEFIII